MNRPPPNMLLTFINHNFIFPQCKSYNFLSSAVFNNYYFLIMKIKGFELFKQKQMDTQQMLVMEPA